MKTIKILFLLTGLSISSMGFGGELFKAAFDGDIAKVQELLAAGADANKADNDGKTPLLVASWKGHLAMVNALIEARADVNQIDKKGVTPLHIASFRGHIALVRLLIEKGANVDEQDKYAHTPLRIASREGRLDVVKLLLDAGADVNKADKYGQTALDVSNSYEITKLLTNAKDNLKERQEKWAQYLSRIKTRPVHRELCRVILGSTSLPEAAAVDTAEPTKPLQEFFAAYPGLAKSIGGSIVRFVDPATAEKFEKAAHKKKKCKQIMTSAKTTDPLPEDAIAIQKLARGFLARKKLRKKNKAATKIQALVRGKLVRK